MAKDEAGGGAAAAAAVAAVEKHFAMHGLYGLPPSAGAMPPSAQTQRPIKHSSSREETPQEEQDFLSTPHSKWIGLAASRINQDRCKYKAAQHAEL